jgi:hypothetical protein
LNLLGETIQKFLPLSCLHNQFENVRIIWKGCEGFKENPKYFINHFENLRRVSEGEKQSHDLYLKI